MLAGWDLYESGVSLDKVDLRLNRDQTVGSELTLSFGQPQFMSLVPRNTTYLEAIC